MKEYWVNVYEYKTVKNAQFYSHNLPDKEEAIFRAIMRKIARPDSRVIYRIHVRMKEVKVINVIEAIPKYEPPKLFFKMKC